MHRSPRISILWAAVLCAALCARAGAAPDYARAVEAFKSIANQTVEDGQLSGFSVAFVDDQKLLYADGFGYADKRQRVKSTTNTVYRCGSISKLFTALMTMQLAEAGKLDIDQPVANYYPRFQIVSPFANAPAITLRQLMCHRSGLIRESPVGSYFDDSEPSVDETVESIADCVLVYMPGTKTKYSNIGVTIVGETAAAVAGQDFVAYQRQHLLEPLGMRQSGFLPTGAIQRDLAKGYLAVAQQDGTFREIVTPHFELGTIPAGNLYTTAPDLARFVSFLFAAAESQVITPETLKEMWTPQLTAASNGFGLGFAVGNYRGHKTVSHSGAVYGFTSSLIAMPEQKLGVIVLANDDLATGPVRKLTRAALDLLLEAKTGQEAEPAPTAIELAAEDLQRFKGDFESESFWATIEHRGGQLTLNISGQRLTLTPVEPRKFLANGRIAHQSPVTFETNGENRVLAFTALDQRFRRVPEKTPEVPEEWKRFLGSYGPDFIPLIVSVKHGRLYAMTENEFDYRLTPLNRFVFKMPPGLYTDEQLVFLTPRNGRAHTAILANMPLERRGR